LALIGDKAEGEFAIGVRGVHGRLRAGVGGETEGCGRGDESDQWKDTEE
jgi:hypothetical protein